MNLTNDFVKDKTTKKEGKKSHCKRAAFPTSARIKLHVSAQHRLERSFNLKRVDAAGGSVYHGASLG